MPETPYVKQRPATRSPRHLVYVSAASDGIQYALPLAERLRSRGFIPSNETQLQQQTRSRRHVLAEPLLASSALILIATPQILKSELTHLEVETFSRTNPDAPVIGIDFEGGLRKWKHQFGAFVTHYVVIPGYRNKAPLDEYLITALVEILEKSKAGPSPQASLFRQLIGGMRPLNEGKLILVGRGEVGKTSLINRLIYNRFRGDEGKTQGINIKRWTMRSSSERVRLNIWDFGGQEIMHATHQFFLTERSLYVLVLNGREGGVDEDAEYWLKHIVTFGGDSPVIIVQNKISQHPFDLNYRGLQTRYPQIRGFIKTDCLDGIGIKDLRLQISKITREMPEIRMEVRSEWLQVKNELESMRGDFISYEKFDQLCVDKGIDDEADRKALGWILHCLGIALNYREDRRLRETSVLKPEWVTKGIYSILNAETVSDRQGELHLSDLEAALPREKYPTEKHGFLLELMRKFSLCFAFPDETDRYLIPELLGKEEPEESQEFTASKCLNFEYHYGVLPEGLLPRFIVRSHTLSRGQSRWRSGVILALEDCSALVKAEIGDRRVVVRIRGGNSNSRRQLLAIIRYDIDRINGEFKDRLEVQPKVPLGDHPNIAIDYDKLVTFERNGIKEFPEVIGGAVISVDVSGLLTGVDLPAERAQLSKSYLENLQHVMGTKSVFLSYSHRDEALRDELEVHLKLLERQNVVRTWHDRKILAGSEWDHEIDNALELADIILLLVSADFLASAYCWDKEIARAVERHSSGRAVVIPVLLRACGWKTAPFAKIQGLPKDMKPITEWKNRDAAWNNVAEGIRAAAEGQSKSINAARQLARSSDPSTSSPP